MNAEEKKMTDNNQEFEKGIVFNWKCTTPYCNKTATTASSINPPPGVTPPGTEPGPCVESKLDGERLLSVTFRHKWKLVPHQSLL
jgi:hypothetical protein